MLFVPNLYEKPRGPFTEICQLTVGRNIILTLTLTLTLRHGIADRFSRTTESN
jgi:hypothetical protein